MFATGIEITFHVSDLPSLHLEPVLTDRGVDDRVRQPEVDSSSETFLPQHSVKLLDEETV